MYLLALLLSQPPSDYIVTMHARGTAYTRVEFETACGVHVIEVQYRNRTRADPMGEIEYFKIDGQPVVGALDELRWRAARRPIDRIGIRNCGLSEADPVIPGYMDLAETGTTVHPAYVPFQLHRVDGVWRISFDEGGRTSR